MAESVADRQSVGVVFRDVRSSVKTLSSVRLACGGGGLFTAAPGFVGFAMPEAVLFGVGRVGERGNGPPSFLHSVLDTSGKRAVKLNGLALNPMR